jgi:hypothetical protein
MDTKHTAPQAHTEQWLSSKEAKQALNISDCQLMHLRLAGKLQFRKAGNRFFYLLPNELEAKHD